MPPEVKEWWEERDSLKQAIALGAKVDQIQALSGGRIRQFNANVETYVSPEKGANGATGARGGYRTGRGGGVNKEQVALPVVWSVIQALASEIATQSPSPQFLTSGGDYKARKQATLLTNLTRGVAYEAKLKAVNAEVFIDACVGGTGYTYHEADWETGKIKSERVYPAEVVTDPNDDIYGDPRSLYRVRYMDRDELRERFKIPKTGEQATRLKTAKTLSGLLAVGNAAQTNMVRVYHGWHRPSSEKAGDGRFVIATSNDSLQTEEYKRRIFPILPFRYDKRLLGWLGVGLSELVGALQNHLNELLSIAQQSMSRHGVPHWLVHNGAMINKQELNDLIGSVIYWNGAVEPKLQTFASFPPDLIEMIQFDLQQIYQMTGVSLMAASAQKPAGLDSGEAIRAYVDTNSKRFQFLGQSWERYHVDQFDFYVDLALEIVEKRGTYPVKLMRKTAADHSLEVLDWKAAKGVKRSEWQIECFPVSSLPQTPTGKLQYVKDLMEIGPDVLSGLDAVELLELPDTSGYLNLELAGRRLCQKWVSDIVDEGRYHPPEADCLPLAWSITHATQVLAKAEAEDAPEKNRSLLRTFIQQLYDLQKQTEPPPPPAPTPAALPPGPAAAPGLAPAPMAPLAPVAQPGQ